VNRPVPRAEIEKFTAALAEKRRRLAKAEHSTRGYRDEDGVWRGGLLSFVRYFWHILEPGTPFVDGWVLEALAEHLEACTFGEITNLLINIFPGGMKSLITNTFYPAWEWGPMELSHLRYVTFSYSSSNTERDNQRFGDLISSPEYQAMYPHVQIRQNGLTMVSNYKHGWKLASSVTGSVTGKRGNRAICDDLNNVKESESKAVMEETNRWFRESLSSRLNSMETDVKIVIAQRVAEGDVSGEILRLGLPYCHLMIPMEYVWQADQDGNPYTTQIGWVDPRWKPNAEDCEGELAWPERFSEKSVQALKTELGPFAAAAQLAQTPEARGGGVLKREWWLPGEQYMPDERKFPPFSYLVASLDGAFDEKEINNPSALTIWGIFSNEHGYNRAMLVHAWAKRLQISGIKVEVEPGEHESVYRRRAMPHWGLVEWVADTCNRFKVDRLLIENKASGKPAAQSLQNSHGRQGWAIVLVEPKGDKYARGLAVQPSFSQGMIYAPDRDWAFGDGGVVDECVIAGTMIITSDGVKPVETLCVGDQVLTHAGRFRPIFALSSRFSDELVRLEPKSLDSITLTSNHPVYAFDLTAERSVRTGSEVDWIRAGSIKPREYRQNIRDGIPIMEAAPSACHAMVLPIIRAEVPLAELDLRDWAALPSGKRYDFIENDDSFTTSHSASQCMRWRQPLDHQFGRVLGLYLAEGSGRRNQTSWSFHADETKFIREIQTFVSERLGCGSHLHTQGRGTTVVANLPLIESFFEECGRGSHNKKVPVWVWDAPDEFIEGVLSGYMDGDGSHNKDTWVATTVSISLAWGIRLLALRVGLHATLRQTRDAGEGAISGRVFKTLPAYSVSWRHDRKNSGATLVIDDLAAYSVMKSSTVDGGEFVFNMDVAEDHSYCTTAGVVHNCAKFPKGLHDDQYDSTTQAIKHLRDTGLLRSDEDRRAEELDAVRHKGAPREAAYPGFRRLARR
jgi:hypothetical protein